MKLSLLNLNIFSQLLASWEFEVDLVALELEDFNWLFRIDSNIWGFHSTLQITSDYVSWSWNRARDSAFLLLRYVFWCLVAEIIQHYFYFNALQNSPHIMEVLNKTQKTKNLEISDFWGCPTNFSIWGRCYDHNFLRFSTIFGEKMAFFSNTNVMIQSLHNLDFSESKMTIFPPFFSKIF
jgi:hypothetical protein